MKKYKEINKDTQNTMHKTEDWATRILETVNSRSVGSSYSTSGTSTVTNTQNMMINQI